MSTTPAPPPPAQRAAVQVPKVGLTRCAGKYEGRWEHVSGMGGMKVVFRSDKATIAEGLGGEMPFDCFTGDGKVVFLQGRIVHAFFLRLRHQQRRNAADARRSNQEDGQLTKVATHNRLAGAAQEAKAVCRIMPPHYRMGGR